MSGGFLDTLLDRDVIIGLAIMGAVLATVGNIWRYRGSANPRMVTAMVRIGYGLTWGSLAVFIVTGLRGG